MPAKQRILKLGLKNGIIELANERGTEYGKYI